VVAGVFIALFLVPLSLAAALVVTALLAEQLGILEAVLFLAVAVAEVAAELLLLPT
jgi:hypothetical protein